MIGIVALATDRMADRPITAEASPESPPNVEVQYISNEVYRFIDHDFGIVCYVVSSGALAGGRGVACLDRLGILEP
jgi:hypothetical protein